MNAITKFLYFIYNIQTFQARQVLSASHCPGHLFEKWLGYCKETGSATDGFVKLCFSLDFENMKAVTNAIEELIGEDGEFKGITPHDVFNTFRKGDISRSQAQTLLYDDVKYGSIDDVDTILNLWEAEIATT